MSPAIISTLRRACQMRTFPWLGERKRSRKRSLRPKPAIPSGRSGPNQAARQRFAIKGAIVRFTAVPPE